MSWPDVSFEVLAINLDIPSPYRAPDGTTGAPYILARGVQVLSDIDLAPESATSLVGTEHTVRSLYLHLIEEAARHNGHADLFRQRLDGSTGE